MIKSDMFKICHVLALVCHVFSNLGAFTVSMDEIEEQ
jgi:hypothetical protein